ncbi:MAG TPA: hypothetical protein VM689_13815 [Aliidongia sp.]|nr:hypothetical protein [Aliidongia sp.]
MATLNSNEREAANRAEATALLIRSEFRVYRPEADVAGEDLVIRRPNGDIQAVQLKSRAYVDWARYGDKKLWMLFPDSKGEIPGRAWYLVPHDELFNWMKDRHGHAPKWKDIWTDPKISTQLRDYLEPFSHRHWRLEGIITDADVLPD